MNILVSNTNTLDDAIITANAYYTNTGGTASITFDPTITNIVSAGYAITGSVNITGNNTNPITITQTLRTAMFDIGNIDRTRIFVNVSGIRTSGSAAAFNLNDSDLTLSYSIITNVIEYQSGDIGGAVVATNSALDMSYCTVQNNIGGVTLITDDPMPLQPVTAEADISKSTFTGNYTNGIGGAIIVNSGLLTLSDSTVSSNGIGANGSTSNGAGIYMGTASDGNIYCCTIVNNVASLTGGGIHLSDTTTDLSMYGTILASNQAPVSPDIFGAFNQTSDNLIGIMDSSNNVDPTFGNKTGSLIMPLDPVISVLRDNGGPTLSHMPFPTSPAINGSSSGYALTSTDQRGPPFLRGQPSSSIGFSTQAVVGSVIDIGSIQNQASVCYIGDTLINVKNIITNSESQVAVRDIKSDEYLVYDVTSESYVPIIYNIVSEPKRRFRVIKKDTLGENLPSHDLYITSGHVVVINGIETKVSHIPESKKCTLRPQPLYSICTKYGGPILIQGMQIMAYSKTEWEKYAGRRAIIWRNN